VGNDMDGRMDKIFFWIISCVPSITK